MNDLVKRLRRQTAFNPYNTDFAEAADRIEALEAALRFMLTDPPSALDEPDTDAEVIRQYREVALAVLAPEPDK